MKNLLVEYLKFFNFTVVFVEEISCIGELKSGEKKIIEIIRLDMKIRKLIPIENTYKIV